MKYNGLICSGCGAEFTEGDDIVVCPECGEPQHRACWMKERRCVGFERHGENYSWEMPAWKRQEMEERQRKEDDEKRASVGGGSLPPSVRMKNGEEIMQCPHCGAVNFRLDAYCLKCGGALHENGENGGETPSGESVPPYDEPFGNTGGAQYDRTNARENQNYTDRFESLRLYGGLDKNVQIDGIPVGELSQYIGGSKPGKFIRRFMMMDRSGRKTSVNPAVILFGPVWYFYRRMPRQGLIFIVISMLLAITGAFVQLDDTAKQLCRDSGALTAQVQSGEITMEEYEEKLDELYAGADDTETVPWRVAAATVCEIASVAVFVYSVFRADYFYRKKIRSDVAAARERNDNMDDYMRDLSFSGGTGILLAMVGAALAGLAYLSSDIPIYYYMFFG